MARAGGAVGDLRSYPDLSLLGEDGGRAAGPVRDLQDLCGTCGDIQMSERCLELNRDQEC